MLEWCLGVAARKGSHRNLRWISWMRRFRGLSEGDVLGYSGIRLRSTSESGAVGASRSPSNAQNHVLSVFGICRSRGGFPISLAGAVIHNQSADKKKGKKREKESLCGR